MVQWVNTTAAKPGDAHGGRKNRFGQAGLQPAQVPYHPHPYIYILAQDTQNKQMLKKNQTNQPTPQF